MRARKRRSPAPSAASTSSSSERVPSALDAPIDVPHLALRQRNKTHGRGRFGLDEPCPTVTAAGMAAASIEQVALVNVEPDRGSSPPAPATDGRPPFRLSTMADVARARGTAGLTVVSTFSGCGGSCLGFEQAGYRPVYALEFVEAARAVYARNHPGVPIDARDVRAVRPDEVLEAAGLERGDVDVLEGSPPCASFSTAGRRAEGWGQVKAYSDTRQRTDDLFFEFARLLEGIRPRAFVAENVYGLVKGAAFGYFEMIIARLRECGYRVKARLLDAQWLGVPQMRQRLIFVGVRQDLGLEPAFPEPQRFRYTIGDALPHLRSVRWDNSGVIRDKEVIDRPSPTITLSAVNGKPLAPYHFQVAGDDMGSVEPTAEELAEVEFGDELAIGREYDNVPIGGASERYFMLKRPDPRRPMRTISQRGGNKSVASVVHPFERRKFTIRELKRLCAFPDDFELLGTYEQQWERLGRSVPPRMMFHVARALRDRVFAPLGRVAPGFLEAP